LIHVEGLFGVGVLDHGRFRLKLHRTGTLGMLDCAKEDSRSGSDAACDVRVVQGTTLGSPDYYAGVPTNDAALHFSTQVDTNVIVRLCAADADASCEGDDAADASVCPPRRVWKPTHVGQICETDVDGGRIGALGENEETPDLDTCKAFCESTEGCITMAFGFPFCYLNAECRVYKIVPFYVTHAWVKQPQHFQIHVREILQIETQYSSFWDGSITLPSAFATPPDFPCQNAVYFSFLSMAQRQYVLTIEDTVDKLYMGSNFTLELHGEVAPPCTSQCERFAYEHNPEACVSGNNIELFSNQTLNECKVRCDALHDCLGFEFYADNGGALLSYVPGDCQLSGPSIDFDGCDAIGNNLDFYTKQDRLGEGLCLRGVCTFCTECRTCVDAADHSLSSGDCGSCASPELFNSFPWMEDGTCPVDLGVVECDPDCSAVVSGSTVGEPGGIREYIVRFLHKTVVAVTTCATHGDIVTSYDTFLSVHNHTTSELLTSNDNIEDDPNFKTGTCNIGTLDGLGTKMSKVVWTALPGLEYRVVVNGSSGEEGDYALEVSGRGGLNRVDIDVFDCDGGLGTQLCETITLFQEVDFLYEGIMGSTDAFEIVFGTVQALQLDISTCVPGTTYDTHLFLFLRNEHVNGGEGELSLLIDNDDDSYCEFQTSRSTVTWLTAAGGAYTLRVPGSAGGTVQLDFSPLHITPESDANGPGDLPDAPSYPNSISDVECQVLNREGCANESLECDECGACLPHHLGSPGAGRGLCTYAFVYDPHFTAKVAVGDHNHPHPLFNVSLGCSDISAAAAADLNADGMDELYVGCSNGNIVALQRSNATGIFAVMVSGNGKNQDNPFNDFVLGQNPAPAFWDADGDGDLDAFFGMRNGRIHMLLNSGTQTAPRFVEGGDSSNPFRNVDVGRYATLAVVSPEEVYVANEAGKVELFMLPALTARRALQTGATVKGTEFERIPEGPFSRLTFPGRATVALWDMDGDGDLDAVVGSRFGGGGTLQQFRNTNDGIDLGFYYTEIVDASSSTNADSIQYVAPLLFDMDGDGDLDLVVSTVDGELGVLSNVGYSRKLHFTLDGQVMLASSVPANPVVDVAVWDVNADGHFDILVCRAMGVEVWYGQSIDGFGTSTFRNSVAVQVVASTAASGEFTSFAAADFDGDADVDILIGSTNGQAQLWWNVGNASKLILESSGDNPLQRFNLPTAEHVQLAAADVDGDGDIDVVMNQIYLENVGTARLPVFSEATFFSQTLLDLNPLRLVLIDLNLDGNIDAVVIDSNSKVHVLESDGSNPASGVTNLKSVSESRQPFTNIELALVGAVDAVDVDRDGDVDVFFLVPGDSSVLAYFKSTDVDCQSECLQRGVCLRGGTDGSTNLVFDILQQFVPEVSTAGVCICDRDIRTDGQTSITDRFTGAACQSCGPNLYGLQCDQSCPPFSTTNDAIVYQYPVARTLDDCECVPPFEKVQRTPAAAVATDFSSNILFDCLCPPGWSFYEGACEACTLGTFKDEHSNTPCTLCQSVLSGSSTANTGATGASLCVCSNVQFNLAGSCVGCPDYSITGGGGEDCESRGCKESFQRVNQLDGGFNCACPAGTKLRVLGTLETCEPCAVGMFQPLASHYESKCHVCETNATSENLFTTLAVGAKSKSECVCVLGMFLGADGECYDCTHACYPYGDTATVEQCLHVCDVGTTVQTLPMRKDFWRSNELSTLVFECAIKGACTGGNESSGGYCSPGHEGPYCEVCMSNYFKNVNGACVECDDDATATSTTLIVITTLLIAIPLFYTLYLIIFSQQLVDMGVNLGRDMVWSGFVDVEVLHQGASSLSMNTDNLVKRSWRNVHARRDTTNFCARCLTDAMVVFISCCFACFSCVRVYVEACLDHIPGLSKSNRDFLAIFQEKLVKSFQVKVKIVFSMLQLLSLLPGVFELDLPEIYLNFLDNLSILSLDLSKFMKFFSLGCVIDPTFYQELLATTLSPFAVAIVLWGTALVARVYRHHQTERKVLQHDTELKRARYQERTREVNRIIRDIEITIKHNEESVQKALQRCKWLMLLFLYLVYPPVVTKTFQVLFDCLGLFPPLPLRPTTCLLSLLYLLSSVFSVWFLVCLAKHTTYSYMFNRPPPRRYCANRAALFLFLPQVFVCEDFVQGDGSVERYLKADYRQNCDTDQHFYYTCYGSLAVLVYPIGIPVLFGYLLYKHKDTIKEKQAYKMELIDRGYDVDQIDEGDDFSGVHELNLLYSEYEPHSWWFEIFEFVRRLLLVGVSVFFALSSATSSSQIVYGILVCLMSISVYENWKPFIESSDNRVSIICQWQIFFALFAGLVLQTQIAESDEWNLGVLGVILIGINCFVFLTFVIEFFRVWHVSSIAAKEPTNSETLPPKLKDLIGLGVTSNVGFGHEYQQPDAKGGGEGRRGSIGDPRRRSVDGRRGSTHRRRMSIEEYFGQKRRGSIEGTTPNQWNAGCRLEIPTNEKMEQRHGNDAGSVSAKHPWNIDEVRNAAHSAQFLRHQQSAPSKIGCASIVTDLSHDINIGGTVGIAKFEDPFVESDDEDPFTADYSHEIGAVRVEDNAGDTESLQFSI
jgi:hypothetical protein